MSDNPRMDSRRLVMRIMWLALSVNLAVVAAKFALGLATGSAMISGDAYFTAVDALVDVMLLVILRLARKPPDEAHPYGHAKFEALGMAGVAVLIFAMLEDLGRRLWGSLTTGVVPRTEDAFIVVLVLTLAVSAALGIYEIIMGRRLGSGSVTADGWYTFSGCGLTVLSITSQFGARAGLVWPDTAGGMIAFAVLIAAGWIVARGAWAALTDEARLDGKAVIRTVMAVPDVLGCHEVRSRGMPDCIHVDLHVQVETHLSVLAAHRIAHLVEDAVTGRHPGVVDVTVHIEPRVNGRATGV